MAQAAEYTRQSPTKDATLRDGAERSLGESVRGDWSDDLLMTDVLPSTWTTGAWIDNELA